MLKEAMTDKKVRLIMGITLLTYLMTEIRGQYPIPGNFTQQTGINLTIDRSITQLVFSPNETSMTYKLNYSDVIGFKLPLLQKITQTVFSRYSTIYDYQYSLKGDRLYVLSRLQPKYMAVIMYQLIGGNIVDYMNPKDLVMIDDFNFYCDSPLFDVSETTIVVSDTQTIYPIDISDINNPTILKKYSIPGYNQGVQINSLKCHPQQKQIILLGIGIQNSTQGQMGIYNTESKTYKTLNQNKTYSLGFLRNGTIIIQQLLLTHILAVYYYSNQTVQFITDIDDFILSETLYNQSLRSISRNGRVFAGVSSKENNQFVKVYEMVEKEPINRVNSIPNVEFNLIFTKKFNISSKHFLGISDDGNQLYLNSKNQQYISDSIARWRRCIDGTFLKDGTCWPCSPTCQTCSLSPTSCTSCPNSTFFKNFSCFECQKAFIGCVQCDNQQCTKCNTTARFDIKPSNNLCYCKINTFHVEDDSYCKLCSEVIVGCLQCEKPTKCGQCNGIGHFYADNDSKCSCVTGYALNVTKCVACSVMPGCLTCSTPTNCTTCDQIHYFQFDLKTRKCQCDPRYYLNQTSCLPCSNAILGCFSCSQDGKICDSCWDLDKVLNPTKTKCQCKNGTYQKGPIQQCVSCDPLLTCVTCINDTYCLSCNQTKHFNPNHIDGKCTCQKGFYPSLNSTCDSCQFRGCLECSDKDNCTKCSEQNGFEVSPFNGTCQCHDQKYPDETASACFGCGQKMVGCLSCTSLTKCLTCDTDKNFTPKNDLTGCQCLPNHFLKGQQCKQCQSFITYCKYCTIFQNAVKCQACNDGFVHNPQFNQCQCLNDYVIENGFCIKKDEQGDNWLMIGGILAGVLIIGVGIGVGLKIRRKIKLNKSGSLNQQGDKHGELRGSVQIEEDDFSDQNKARKRLLESSILSDATGARRMLQ